MPQRYIDSWGTARASWRSWMQDPLGQKLQHLQKLIADWLEAENLSTTSQTPFFQVPWGPMAKPGRSVCVPSCQLVPTPMVGTSPGTTILISEESKGRATLHHSLPPRLMPKGLYLLGVIIFTRIKVLQTVVYSIAFFGKCSLWREWLDEWMNTEVLEWRILWSIGYNTFSYHKTVGAILSLLPSFFYY